MRIETLIDGAVFVWTAEGRFAWGLGRCSAGGGQVMRGSGRRSGEPGGKRPGAERGGVQPAHQ
jgi:hypothetical protein